jgi:hypothetical protein
MQFLATGEADDDIIRVDDWEAFPAGIPAGAKQSSIVDGRRVYKFGDQVYFASQNTNDFPPDNPEEEIRRKQIKEAEDEMVAEAKKSPKSAKTEEPGLVENVKTAYQVLDYAKSSLFDNAGAKEIIKFLAADAPDAATEQFLSATGLDEKLPQHAQDAAKEAMRMITGVGLATAVLGFAKNPAMASQALATTQGMTMAKGFATLLKQVPVRDALWGAAKVGGIAAAISEGFSFMGLGGAQDPGDVAVDTGAMVGESAGIPAGLAARESIKAFVDNQKATAALVRAAPGPLKYLPALVSRLAGTPKAPWAAGGKMAGATAGFSEAGGDFGSLQVLALTVPGAGTVIEAGKAAGIAQRLGGITDIAEVFAGKAKGAVTASALRMRQRVKDAADALIEAGAYNNLSAEQAIRTTADEATAYNAYAYMGDKEAQAQFNRRHGQGKAIEESSKQFEAAKSLLFGNQWKVDDAVDALEVITNAQVSDKGKVARKVFSFVDAAPKPVKPDREPFAAKHDWDGYRKATEDYQTNLGKWTEAQKGIANRAPGEVLARTANDINILVRNVVNDPKKLTEFKDALDSLDAAIPPSSTVSRDKQAAFEAATNKVNKVKEKMKDVLILEGIFGSGFSETALSVGEGELGGQLFKGKKIQDYITANEGQLKEIFGAEQTQAIKDVSTLMAFQQQTDIDSNIFERQGQRLMQFFSARLVFSIAAGALTPTGKTGKDTLVGMLLGLGAVATGKDLAVSASKMAKWGIKNPDLMHKYVQAAVKGETVVASRYLRSLIRTNDPELAEEAGLNPYVDEEAFEEISPLMKSMREKAERVGQLF